MARIFNPAKDCPLATLFLTRKAAERAALGHITRKRLTDAKVYIREQRDRATGMCQRGWVAHIKPQDRNGYDLAGV